MPFEGLSRREVVRRVGLGMVAALPVISFIFAPEAASVASVRFAPGSRTLRQLFKRREGLTPSKYRRRKLERQRQIIQKTAQLCAQLFSR